MNWRLLCRPTGRGWWLTVGMTVDNEKKTYSKKAVGVRLMDFLPFYM